MRERISYWLQACRLRTLSLAVATVGLGSGLAYQYDTLSLDILLLSLLTASGLQILSNLANDLGDSLHGIDHKGRSGPIRMAQKGHLSKKSLRRAMLKIGLATLGCGLGLLWQAFGLSIYFWFFFGLGLLAIWAALRYAYGGRPYGHAGWGDLAVWIFFGIVGVKGTYFLHTESFRLPLLLPAAAMGAWAVIVLNINNLRDIDSDLVAGKRTLAARLGRRGAVRYHCLLLFAAMLCWLLYGYLCLPMGWSWLFVIVYPGWIGLAFAVRAQTTVDLLNRRLPQASLLSLLQVLVFVAGIWLSK